MGKEAKTNAMRMLDKAKIPYEVIQYECDEFIDGLHTAEITGAPVEQSFKTLVMQGKSKQYYVFVLPIAEEVQLKTAAKVVGEKSVEMIPVKDIEIEINDGCGIMTPEYSRKITNDAVGIDDIASGVCARCAFFKGMLFTFDFKDFAENVAHKYIIVDAWGHERDVRFADVIATTSQLKLWDAMLVV